MGKIRNLLRQVKERAEQEIREYENQQHQNAGSLLSGPNSNNTQENPSLLGFLGSAIERSFNSPLERPAPSDHNPRYETVFCDTCLKIKTHQGRGSIYSEQGVNISLEDLESAVEDGCHFCSLLTQGLYGLVPDTKGTHAILNLRTEGGSVVMRVGKEDANPFVQGDWRILEFFTTYHSPFPLKELGGLELLREPECLITPGDTSSAASLRNVQDWIKTCTQQHRSCDRSATPLLPTRILDVAAWPTIKLREPRNQKAQYITLSHSWGGHHPIVTTNSSLLKHKQGIQFNALPKTYQDAILITRQLGLQYIWIDSLCILQDNKLDWENEAAKMAEVYQNAWLTISATRSSSPTSGCYNSTEIQMIELKGTIRNSPFILYTRNQMEHVPSHWGPDPGNQPQRRFPLPLLARGWAFQERLLSARVLHFGPQDLFWECRERVTCECTGIKEWDKEANIVTYQGAPPKITHNRFVNAAAKQGQMHARWRSMVEEYSQRRLTVGTDRLPAFAGVATEMQGHLKQRYLAGLWEDSFVLDLCWKRADISSGRGRTRKRGGSSLPGIPSWSWAAVDCEVNYNRNLIQPDAKKIKDSMIGCCEILEVQWTPTSPDAYMMLEAWVIPGRLGTSDTTTERGGESSY